MKLSSIVILLIIIFLEILIYFYSQYVAPDHISEWQLASRYSARISFILFFIMQIYVAKSDKSFTKLVDENTFTSLFLAFAFNHLIHLGFLLTSSVINEWSINYIARIPEIIGWLTLVFFVFIFLFNLKTSAKLINLLKVLFIGFSVIFFVAYFKRMIGTPPEWSSNFVYTFLTVVSFIGLSAILKSIFYKTKK